MRYAIAASVEEYEIAGAKIIAFNFLAFIPTEHVPRTTRKVNSELLHNIPRESGAIKAAWSRSAVRIVRSEERINRFVELGVRECATHLNGEQ
jgi:hypothetical protein